MGKLKNLSTWLNVISTAVLSVGMVLASNGAGVDGLMESTIAIAGCLTTLGVITAPKTEVKEEEAAEKVEAGETADKV